MRVAVVTAVYKPKLDWLQQCHESVLAQTHPCTHVLVCDGGAQPKPKAFAGQIIELQHHHNDWGDTPRSVGALSAFAQNFDAVLWCDQDNWLEPKHVHQMAALQQTSQAPVCTSNRVLWDYQSQRLGICRWTDGRTFVDANCFFLTRSVANFCAVWALMPSEYHLISDRYFLRELHKHRVPMSHTTEPTVNYRTNWAFMYRTYGRVPPPGARSDATVDHLIQQLNSN